MIWIALIRGINVGGNHPLPMSTFVSILEDAGCTDVATYIQSGNAAFNSDKTDASPLEDQIAKGVLEKQGFEPRVLLLSARQLEEAVKSNPFPDAVTEPKSLQLYFLEATPTSPNWEQLEMLKSAREAYRLIENVFYLHAPDGIGRSKLAARVERLLGVGATARNWRTVSKLLEMGRSLQFV